jgi:hypothetical protein
MQLEISSTEELWDVYNKLTERIQDIEQQVNEVLPGIYRTRAAVTHILVERGEMALGVDSG